MIKTAWPKESKNDVYVKIVLFLISPFLGFLYSLRTMNRKSSYVIFFLFSIVFGLCFSVSNIRLDGTSDGISYRFGFENIRYESFQDYKEGLKGFLSFDDGQKDYYFDTIAFFVSRITDNYHIMFMVFAIIFSFFMLKTFKFFTTEEKFDISVECLILVFLFTINQIYNINGMRFWTAAWIGVYCIFQIVKKKNRRYYLLLLLTPFFHGTFWFFIGVFLICQLLKRFQKIWIVLFFLSFIFSNISVSLISNSVDFLPGFLQNMVIYYTDQEYIESRNASGTGWWWVDSIFDFLVRLVINIIMILFIVQSKKIQSNNKSKSLFQFLMVYVTIVNFVMAVPSLGGRFIMLAYPLIAYIWLINFKGVKYQNFLYCVPFAYFMVVFYLCRDYIDVLSLDFFIASPIYLMFKYLFVV